MRHGFKFKPTELGEWRMGQGVATKRFGAAPINPSGQWDKYVPEKEKQNNGFESMNCTVYGSLNALETLAKFHSADFPLNCSERFSGVMANTTPDGNDPHAACEAIRRWGVVPESVLPFSEDIRSWDYYYAPKPMDEGLLAEAQKVVRRLVLGHEYVFNGGIVLPSVKQSKLKEALTRGTVCVSVDAWKKRDGLYYKDGPDNHWTHLTGYVEGKYWKVRDSYAPFDKKLEWGTDFQTAKLYFLKKNETGLPPNESDLLSWLKDLLIKARKWLGFGS